MFKRLFMAAVAVLACAGHALAAPVVALTAPATNTKYTPPAAIALTASASDSSGTIARVEFLNGTALIGTVTTSPYTFIWDNVASGKYSIKARATNSAGTSTTSSAIVVAVNTPPTVTLTAPAAGASYAGLATVTMSADAADADGTISKVAFYRGGTLIGSTTTPPYSVTWANAPVGTYSITARATDNLGSVTTSAAAAVTVTNPVTVAMTAPANNTKYAPPAAIDLSATASDSNGTIAQVEFLNGAALIGTATTAPYTFAWTNVATGKYTVTARATDNQGITRTSSAIHVVVDTPPTVTLTAPAANSSYVGLATVNLAADVTDADGTIAKVQFYRGATLIGTAAGAPYTATWANVPPGTYPITAKAIDNLGSATTSAVSTITVTNPITVSMAAPLNNARFIPPAAIDLSANASDSNGSIAKIDFYNGAALIGSVTSPPYTVPWTQVPAGKYKITAKATDSQGISRTSSALTIVVDTSPNVALSSPLPNASYGEPAAITLTAGATDPDGTIAKVQFYRGGTLLATVTSPPYTATWNNVAKGSYTLTARATDNLGVTTTSTPVAITVGAHPPPAVSLSSPTSTDGLIAPAAIALAASASASDAGIAQVEFFNGAALIGRITQAPYSVTWSNVAAGSYSLTARATDTLGATADSSPLAFTVASNGAPAVSLTSPSDNQRFIGPLGIPLAASATDADGSIAKVEFFDGGTLLGTATQAPYGMVLPNVTPGTYVFTARATDNLGAVTISATASVTVVPNSTPTISVAASPAAATAPAAVTLTATAADADGSIAQVEFFNGATSLGIASQAPYVYHWNNVAAGSYRITAKATDNLGALTASDPVALAVYAAPTVSVSAPRNNTVYAAPAAIALTTDAASVNGAISSVDYYNGATLIGTALSPPYRIDWSNVAAGSYIVTAVATDSVGAVAASSAVAITVQNNVAPTVSVAATPGNAIAPATLTLSATAADSDGTVTQVDFYSGATLIGIAATAPYTFSWNGLAPGTYTVTAVATDNLGATATSAPATVTVTFPPTVTLSAPAANTVYTGPATIPLTAAASQANGAIAQVAFYNGTTLIGTATQAPYSISWANVAAGSYSVTARATDAFGNSVTSAVVTVVVNAPPTVSLVAPTNNATFVAPAAINMTAVAADSDGSIAQVDFYAGATLIGTATAAPYTVNWNNVTAGNYSVTARATDNGGAVSTSTPINVTVINNALPTVSVSANPVTATAPATITLSANAADSDGSISQVEFFNGATRLATVTTPPYTYSWSNVGQGSYSITAKATDNLGGSTTSSPVNVTVTGAPGQVYYIQSDQLNTPRLITDGNNMPVWQWANADAFGMFQPDDNPSGLGIFTYNPRFPGTVFDRETNLFYNMARYLDPQLGRYTTFDPLGLAAGINGYIYVDNQPTRYIDPKGLWGIGVNAGGTAEAGAGPGGATQANSGVGIFGGGSAGVNTGGYTANGGFAGSANSNQFAAGATAGLGVGAFATNAKCAKNLLGPFDTWTVNLPILSVQYATDGTIWTAGISLGKSFGFSASRYSVTTTTASGCECQ